MTDSFLEGFILQSSLIMALGAQNLFVLECGLRKRRHLLVATLCSICDTFLIALGVLGAGSLFTKYPILKISFGAVGVLFLAYYGILKLFEKPKSGIQVSQAQDQSNLKSIIACTLAFSLLNPHVYLDAIVLLGGYSAGFATILERSLFGAGAALVSILWFFGLSSLSAQLSPLIGSIKALRRIYFVSGAVLLALAVNLGIEVAHWWKANPISI